MIRCAARLSVGSAEWQGPVGRAKVEQEADSVASGVNQSGSGLLDLDRQVGDVGLFMTGSDARRGPMRDDNVHRGGHPSPNSPADRDQLPIARFTRVRSSSKSTSIHSDEDTSTTETSIRS